MSQTLSFKQSINVNNKHIQLRLFVLIENSHNEAIFKQRLLTLWFYEKMALFWQ